jgi:hypothetical protein
MRTGYLVAAVMLFASGAAFAQSIDETIEVTATGGGSTISARAAARLERRTERRDRREARLNALRSARGLQARQGSEVSGFAAIEDAARLMFVPADETLPVDETAPETDESGDEPVADESQFFLMSLTAEGEATAEGDVVTCELYDGEVPEDCEVYTDEVYDDGLYVDGEPVKDGEFEFPEGEEWPLIYTLGAADSEIIVFRGNAGEHANGRALGLAAPLDHLRGNADAHAAAHTEVGASQRAGNPDRAAQILARRLAQIDAMRDRALADGNAVLLETADRLEASARLRFQTEAGEEAPATEPADTGSEPAGEAAP